MLTLTEHFEHCALAGREKQAKFLRLVGEHSLELDLDAGIARFTKHHAFPFQVLGTESENSLSWLWAWADEQTEMPASLVKASQAMKVWLETKGLQEYALPSVDLDRADGTMLSLIATDVCSAGCFYREHYEGGSLFLLLFSSEISAQDPFDRKELVRSLDDLIELYDFNHRNALLSYFRASGIAAAGTAETVSATLPNGETVIAEFDAHGRLTAINGERRG
jgi:hypothetical protein